VGEEEVVRVELGQVRMLSKQHFQLLRAIALLILLRQEEQEEQAIHQIQQELEVQVIGLVVMDPAVK
jgi:hypothetical protein